MPEAIRDKYQYFTQANLLRLRGAGYAAPVTTLENAIFDYVRKYLVPDRRLDPRWNELPLNLWRVWSSTCTCANLFFQPLCRLPSRPLTSPD